MKVISSLILFLSFYSNPSFAENRFVKLNCSQWKDCFFFQGISHAKYRKNQVEKYFRIADRELLNRKKFYSEWKEKLDSNHRNYLTRYIQGINSNIKEWKIEHSLALLMVVYKSSSFDPNGKTISKNSPEFGSNAFSIVSSQKSFVAYDPHISFDTGPNVFIMNLFKNKERVIFGISVPGIPGLVMGGDKNIAYGFTAISNLFKTRNGEYPGIVQSKEILPLVIFDVSKIETFKNIIISNKQQFANYIVSSKSESNLLRTGISSSKFKKKIIFKEGFLTSTNDKIEGVDHFGDQFRIKRLRELLERDSKNGFKNKFLIFNDLEDQFSIELYNALLGKVDKIGKSILNQKMKSKDYCFFQNMAKNMVMSFYKNPTKVFKRQYFWQPNLISKISVLADNIKIEKFTKNENEYCYKRMIKLSGKKRLFQGGPNSLLRGVYSLTNVVTKASGARLYFDLVQEKVYFSGPYNSENYLYKTSWESLLNDLQELQL